MAVTSGLTVSPDVPEDESARVFRVGSPATAAMAALLLHASSKL